MDDESKPQPLDYGRRPPKRQTWKTFMFVVLMILGTTIVSLIAAFIVASFLMPAGGGH
jgi:hypothetical protein